jgi:hypothetical protein
MKKEISEELLQYLNLYTIKPREKSPGFIN